MSDETKDPEKLIVFRPETSFPVARREKVHCKCSGMGEKYHTGQLPAVWICERERILECKTCGAIIDPFDYLWTLATEGESLTRELQRMREEKVVLKAQKTLLEEQNSDLRAEGRKLAKSPRSKPDEGAEIEKEEIRVIK